MSTVGDVMRREPVMIAPEDTLGEAAEKMVAANAGAALVSDFGRMIGILTERDILRAVGGRTHSSEARVREWMTKDPVTVTADVSKEEAARIMLERNFRHLPIVEGERAVGIVSLRQVAATDVR